MSILLKSFAQNSLYREWKRVEKDKKRELHQQKRLHWWGGGDGRMDRAVIHCIIAAKFGFDKSLKKSRINIKICLLQLFVATKLLWMQQKSSEGGSRRICKGRYRDCYRPATWGWKCMAMMLD
eukprot:scaffold2488_cov140-Skeletonema_menzelii.AAC.1